MRGPTDSLAPEILSRGIVAPDGLHVWRIEDVSIVTAAARAHDLAVVEVQPRFQLPNRMIVVDRMRVAIGKRSLDESWESHVARTTREAEQRVLADCTVSQFQEAAAASRPVSDHADKTGIDPLEYARIAVRLGSRDGSVDRDSVRVRVRARVPPRRARSTTERASGSGLQYFSGPFLVIGSVWMASRDWFPEGLPMLLGIGSFVLSTLAAGFVAFGGSPFHGLARFWLFLWNIWPLGLFLLFLLLIASF